MTGTHRPQHRQQGHQRLARAHVTLHQALHGDFARKVPFDLLHHPLLRAGQREGQALPKTGDQRVAARQGKTGMLLHPAAQLAQAEDMGQ